MNWARRTLLSLTRKAIPQLDRVLTNAGGTVERLAETATLYKEQLAEQRAELAERAEAFRSELNEAIALASDPWVSVGESQRTPACASGLVEARKQIPLRETIYGLAELEIALDDRGWKRMLAYSTYEFSRYGIQSIILIVRLYFIKNPLVRRGIQVSAFYVFGRGMDVTSPDADADKVIKAFFADPRNASQLSHPAFVKHEETLWTDGNLFWAFFTDAQTGETVIRNIDSLEIGDIITDPNDSSVPWFYHRMWSEQTLDPNTGQRSTTQRDEWYVTVGYDEIENFPGYDTIEGRPIAKDDNGNPIPILHHKEGYLPKWRFGCPLAYPALDWARALREFLENLCTVWKALSRITLTAETKGGAPAIAALKQTLATTFMNDLTSIETNPAPVTGSAFVSGPGTKVTPMKTSGMTPTTDDARGLMHMVCAAFGLGEHFFGNIESGNLATASALDRPTELMFLERQEAWRATVQLICRHVLRQSLHSPSGKLREAMAARAKQSAAEFDPKSVVIEMAPIRAAAKDSMVALQEAKKQKAASKSDTVTVACTFPSIVEGDTNARIKSLVSALTLDGYAPIGIDEKVGIEMLLSELGYEDAHELVEEMFPEDTYERDRTQETDADKASRITAKVEIGADGEPVTPHNADDGSDKQPAPTPAKNSKKSALTAKEMALIRAVAGLRKVIKLQEARQNVQ